MDRTIYAHLKLIPTSFPDVITIQYRVADPKSNSFTGEGYQGEDSWGHIRATYIVTEADLDKVEEYLKAGHAANFGFHYIGGEFPTEESEGTTLVDHVTANGEVEPFEDYEG